MRVTLVLTEHSGALTEKTLAQYELVRARVGDAAGDDVTAIQYEQVETLQDAEAVVLSGSFAPWTEHAPEAIDRLGNAVRAFAGPVLGICAGMQLQARFAGGTIRPAVAGPAKGFTTVEVLAGEDLLRGFPQRIDVYQHHSDEIEELPGEFHVLARSSNCAIEAIAAPERRWWGTQFHPEEFDAAHPAGERILRNFFELARAT